MSSVPWIAELVNSGEDAVGAPARAGFELPQLREQAADAIDEIFGP